MNLLKSLSEETKNGIKRFFKQSVKYPNRNANIAQIILCVFFLPLICFIAKFLIGDNAKDILFEIIDEVPFTHIWINLIKNYADSNTISISLVENSLKQYYGFEIYKVATVAMCIVIFKNIHYLLCSFKTPLIRGYAIIASFIGAVIGCIVSNRLSGSLGKNMMIFIVVVIINLIVIWINPSSGTRKWLKFFIDLSLSMIYEILCICYIACLALISSGAITSLVTSLVIIICILAIFITILIIDYKITTPFLIAD